MNKISSGIKGLDDILIGGFIENRSYLIRGGPGSGKTTLGMHFLNQGIKNNEKVLFINMGETINKIIENCPIEDLEYTKIDFLDLGPQSKYFTDPSAFDVFTVSEIEREEFSAKVTEKIKKLKPSRVLLDPTNQLKNLFTDNFQFKKQFTSFLKYLTNSNATVLLTSESNNPIGDEDLQFMSDGVIDIEMKTKGRSISINKYRGSGFRFGKHSLAIDEKKGCIVYPQIKVLAKQLEFERRVLSTGIKEMDKLLNGGIEKGTATLITGPSGVGKTTIGVQMMLEAAKRGERPAIYTFEERINNLAYRCDQIGMNFSELYKENKIKVKSIEPLKYSSNQFAHIVEEDIVKNNVDCILIDSTAGYSLSLRGEEPISHIHALVRFAINKGVTVMIINEMSNIIGDDTISDLGISYLADNIIFLRYFQNKAELLKIIGVLKKRYSDHEKTLRELRISKDGLIISKPVSEIANYLSESILNEYH